MRNKNHNRRGVLNTSNPDWNEDRGNYGRGYQNHGYEGDHGNSNFSYGNDIGSGTSIGGRYENYGSDRNYNERRNYDENQFTHESGLNRGRYQGNTGYQNNNDWRSSSGSDFSRDYLNYGSEGGGNRSRDDHRHSDFGNREGGNFGGGNYGSDYNRNRRGNTDDDRGWWDKTSDEVSSWFGDENAERRREGDKQRSGEHKGKGPKGYRRSDDRIKEDINDRLSDDFFIDASEIEVTVVEGEVTLTGSVGGRNEKRRAEDIAEGVSGVRNVENRIRLYQAQSPGQKESSKSPSSDTETSAGSYTNGRNKVRDII